MTQVILYTQQYVQITVLLKRFLLTQTNCIPLLGDLGLNYQSRFLQSRSDDQAQLRPRARQLKTLFDIK